MCVHFDALKKLVVDSKGFEFVEEGARKKKGFVGLKPGAVLGYLWCLVNLFAICLLIHSFVEAASNSYFRQCTNTPFCRGPRFFWTRYIKEPKPDSRAARQGQRGTGFGAACTPKILRAHGSRSGKVGLILSFNAVSCLLLPSNHD